MPEIHEIIKKKLGEAGLMPSYGDEPQKLPTGLFTPIPRPQPAPLETGIAEGIGVPQVAPLTGDEQPFPKFPTRSSDPTTDEAPPLIDYRAKMADKLTVPGEPIRSRSEILSDKLTALDTKDYGIEKDKTGNVIHRGKDRNEKWSFLEKLAGAAIGFAEGGVPGAVQAATDRNYLSKMRDKMRRADLIPKLEQAQQQEAVQTQQNIREAQLADIPVEREYKTEVLDEKRQARIDKGQTDALKKLVSLKHYDPGNRAHSRLAAAAGLDTEALKGWDDRNPLTKQVAGVTYKYNRESGAYEPSNLPVDETKTVTNYEVEMPDGEKRKYRVAQKDAASFSTQMSALGAKLAQQESQFSRRLALDKAKFTQAKGEFERVMGLRQQQFNALEQARAQKNVEAERQYQLELDKYDTMLEKMLTASRSAVDLDDIQKAEIEEFVRSKRP